MNLAKKLFRKHFHLQGIDTFCPCANEYHAWIQEEPREVFQSERFRYHRPEFCKLILFPSIFHSFTHDICFMKNAIHVTLQVLIFENSFVAELPDRFFCHTGFLNTSIVSWFHSFKNFRWWPICIASWLCVLSVNQAQQSTKNN
jgi:hypothetical protein